MEGPLRFRCPPEFEAVTPWGGAGLRGGVLGAPSKELWLIRAPADFCPESLEGCSVPLAGTGQLQPPEGQPLRLQGGRGGTGGALLLAPAAPSGGPLACAPPLRGCLTITQRFGPPPPPPGAPPGAPPGSPPGAPQLPAKRKKRKKEKRLKELPEEPQVPLVCTPQRAVPGGEGQCQLAAPQDPQAAPQDPQAEPQDPQAEAELPRRRRKKKKKKEEKHKEEEEELQ